VAASPAITTATSAPAAALLHAAADPDRGFDAVVIGEFERAFSAGQARSVIAELHAWGITVWLAEFGGPVDLVDTTHRALLMLLGHQAEREVLRARRRTTAAMCAQVRIQGRHLGGRPPYGYRLGCGWTARSWQGETAQRGSRLGHRILVDCCLTGSLVLCRHRPLPCRDQHHHDEKGSLMLVVGSERPLAAPGQQVVLRAAPDEVVEDLIDLRLRPARQPLQFGEVHGVEVAHSPISDPPALFQLHERLNRLPQRRRTPPVQQIQVEPVGLQPA
jgi:hypothetical protein